MGTDRTFEKTNAHWTDKIMGLIEQSFLRLTVWVMAMVVGIPYVIWQSCIYPPNSAEHYPSFRRLQPITRAESTLWIICLIGLLVWGFDWSHRDTIHGHYIANGKRAGLTIRQGEVIELPMPCTLQLGGDRFEVRIRRSNNELRWVEPPGHSARLEGKRQTRYPIKVTRLGPFKRMTVEAVVYAKPPN